MISRKLWLLIHNTLPHTRLYRLLLPRAIKPDAPALSPLLYAIGMGLYIYVPFLMLPLTVHYFGLQLAWKIAHASAEQREQGHYDLLAIVPTIGDFGLLIEICRIYCNDVTDRANRFYESVTALTALGVLVFLCSFPSDFLMRLIVTVLLGIFLAWENRQSQMLAMLVGSLAGTNGERDRARLVAIGGYIGLQLMLYALLLITVIIFARALQWTSVLVIILSLVGAVGVFYLAREAVIFLLWQWLRQRIDDDVPAWVKGTP